MRQIWFWAVVAVMAFLTYTAGAAAPAKKKTTGKKNPTSSARKSTRTANSRRGKDPAKRPATTWRNRQTQPTAGRYKEIQQALAAKGYMNPEEATGVWGESSTEAMRRFQADQKLETSGKINSLSLIALGLGPKRDPAPAPKPAGQTPELPAAEK